MKYIQNLHTHTTFCDGKHTPEEMVGYALKQGFTSLGFSGHSSTTYSPGIHTLTPEATDYRAEILRLKEKYADQISLYIGMEFDMYSNAVCSGYDYLIGTVHYLKKGEKYIGFDRSAEVVEREIREDFGGDGMLFAKEYYHQLAELPRYGNFDIIGHFDLITKNIEKSNLFDWESEQYRAYALEAMDALCGKIPFFEVNTGAISRGYRTSPYPTPDLVREFRKRGFGAVISSDCHDGTQLACHFEQAAQLLLAAGFEERYILTDAGFEAVSLKEN